LIQLSDFFQRANPTPVPYNFTYYEDLFAQDAKAPTPVNVVSKSYRNVQLHNPGKYVVRATTAGGLVTEATWEVRDIAGKKVAKNVLFFVGDGMAGSMISAARLLAHKTINGKYQSVMKMDEA
jgi:alkaline phosphatase